MSHTVETLLHLKLQNQMASNGFACPGALFFTFIFTSYFRASCYFHVVKKHSTVYLKLNLVKLNYDF